MGGTTAHLSQSGWEGTALELLRAEPTLGYEPEDDHEQLFSSLHRCVMAVTTGETMGQGERV